MSVTAGVSEAAISVWDKLRGKIGQTKVERYWPGKAPEWVDEADEDIDIKPSRAAVLEQAFPKHEDSDIIKSDDRRLRCLAEFKADNKEEIRADHRRILQAEIITTIEEETRRQERLDFEEDDEIAIEEEEEEEESEYEADSEEEQTSIAMVKPVFIPKAQCDTIVERDLKLKREGLKIGREKN